jgi:hypothetical protein
MVGDEPLPTGTIEVLFESFPAIEIKNPKPAADWPVVGKLLQFHLQELTSTRHRFSQQDSK